MGKFKADESVWIQGKDGKREIGKVVGFTEKYVKVWKKKSGMYIRTDKDNDIKQVFFVNENQLSLRTKEEIRRENEQMFVELFNFNML